MSFTNFPKCIPKFRGIRRHYLHSELKKSNPHLTLKQRNKIIDYAEVKAFLKWLGASL